MSESQRLWLLAATLAGASAWLFQKYFGLAGAAVYLAGIFALAPLLPALDRRAAALGRAQALALGALSLALLAVSFALVYPVADSGVVGGGSDRDEALNLAAGELLAGRYPYYPRTYLDGPISPFPGAVLLAAPFVLLGNSAFQNLFWLAALAAVAARWLGSGGRGLALLWTLLLASPGALNELMVGGDLLANACYVATLALLLLTEERPRRRLLLAALLGLALSSRLNYLLVAPPLLAHGARRRGVRAALGEAGVIGAAWAAVTLPLYLADPAGFSPLHTVGKLAQFGAVIPGAEWAITALAGAAALALALRPLPPDDERATLAACALVQAIPVLCGAALASVQQGRLDLSFTYFGLNFLALGTLAFWPGARAAETWSTSADGRRGFHHDGTKTQNQKERGSCSVVSSPGVVPPMDDVR